MYRILIADDEGLMLEAFKGIILAEFGEKCIVEQLKPWESGDREMKLTRILCLWTFTAANQQVRR